MTQKTEKKISLKPLGDRVLVQRTEQEDTLKGGIILPDTAKKKQEMAIVIAVGKGKISPEGNMLPMPVKEGDKVLMDKYAGQEITIEDEEYVVLRSDDIIATIEG